MSSPEKRGAHSTGSAAAAQKGPNSWPRPAAALLRAWRRHESWFSRFAIAFLSLVALAWLGYQFWRLLFQGEPRGAIDLGQRHREVGIWFEGRPLYELTGTAVYPPASYAMMWPFLGWLELIGARWLWFFTTLPVLYWVVRTMLRESLACGAKQRALVALIPLTFYATGATIGNGQLTLHVVAALLAGLLLILRPVPCWKRDLFGALLVVFALIKVTVAAPFFWIVMFAPRRLRPALFVILGYAVLTLIAASFQEADLLTLLDHWLHRAQEGTKWGASRGSSSNVHTWLSLYSLNDMHRAVTCGILAFAGLLVFVHRRADPWFLIGITAVITRFFVYHMWYDDLLILFPIIALLRLANLHASDWRASLPAGTMLLCCLPTMIAPGGLYTLPSPWKEAYELFQTVLWVLMAIFLYVQILRGKRTDSADISPA